MGALLLVSSAASQMSQKAEHPHWLQRHHGQKGGCQERSIPLPGRTPSLAFLARIHKFMGSTCRVTCPEPLNSEKKVGVGPKSLPMLGSHEGALGDKGARKGRGSKGTQLCVLSRPSTTLALRRPLSANAK